MLMWTEYGFIAEKCFEVSFFLRNFAAMNDLINISSLIYEIRGQKVMLDFDLARLYRVETSQLKRSVRRNYERFEGDDFMFEVTWDELSRCQIGTLNVGQGHNIKYLPFAFTEMGVAMLSSVLRSKTAIEINRGIMRAFTEFRKIATSLPKTNDDVAQFRKDFEELKLDIEDILKDQNDINEMTRMHLDNLDQAFALLQSERKRDKPKPIIGFGIKDND